MIMARGYQINDASCMRYVCERELWIGNGEDTPMQMIDSGYSIHPTYCKAELECCFWMRKGWKTRLFQEES